MGVVRGATTFLEIDNRIVGKANSLEFDPSLELDASESLGKYGADELIYVDMPPVPVSFTLEREAYNGLVAQGLYPDVSSDYNITSFKPLTIVARDKISGATMHKVNGFKPTRKPISFEKGRKSMYRVEGQGLMEVEKDT